MKFASAWTNDALPPGVESPLFFPPFANHPESTFAVECDVGACFVLHRICQGVVIRFPGYENMGEPEIEFAAGRAVVGDPGARSLVKGEARFPVPAAL